VCYKACQRATEAHAVRKMADGNARMHRRRVPQGSSGPGAQRRGATSAHSRSRQPATRHHRQVTPGPLRTRCCVRAAQGPGRAAAEPAPFFHPGDNTRCRHHTPSHGVTCPPPSSSHGSGGAAAPPGRAAPPAPGMRPSTWAARRPCSRRGPPDLLCSRRGAAPGAIAPLHYTCSQRQLPRPRPPARHPPSCLHHHPPSYTQPTARSRAWGRRRQRPPRGCAGPPAWRCPPARAGSP
jgi:hypothetical protein